MNVEQTLKKEFDNDEILQLQNQAKARLKEILDAKLNGNPIPDNIIDVSNLSEKKDCIPCKKKAENLLKNNDTLNKGNIKMSLPNAKLEEGTVLATLETVGFSPYFNDNPGSCSYCNQYIPFSKLHTPITVKQLEFIQSKEAIRMECGSIAHVAQTLMEILYYNKDFSPYNLLNDQLTLIENSIDRLKQEFKNLDDIYFSLEQTHLKEFEND